MPPIYRTNPINGEVFEIEEADLPAFEAEVAAALAQQQGAGTTQQPFYLSTEETRPVQSTGLAGQVGYPLYAGLQGATFNLTDEALGLLFPETAKNLQEGYKQYAAENPKASTAAELVGGLGSAAIPATWIARLPMGAAKAAQALQAANTLGQGSLKGAALSSAISGAGAGEGLYNRLFGGLVGAGLGFTGGAIGQKLASLAGDAATAARTNVPTLLPEQQKAGRLLTLENPELAEPAQIQNAITALRGTPELMLGEAAGAPQQIIRAAQEPSGAAIQEALMQRGKTRGERLLSSVAETTGIKSKRTPEKLARVAKETTRQFERESEKRYRKVGEKVYGNLPELQEKLNLKGIGKMQQSAYRAQDVFEGDVVDEFGEAFYEKYVSPQTSNAVKAKMQKQIAEAGIGSEEAAVRATARMVSKRPIEKALDKLAKQNESKIGLAITNVAEAGRKEGINTAGNRTLKDYKKIVQYLKTLARDIGKSPDKGEFANVKSSDVLKVANQMNRLLQEAVPGMKEVDWWYKWIAIPSGYGGLTKGTRDVVSKLARTQETEPQKFGKTLLAIAPKTLRQILRAADRVGDTKLKEGFKAGLKAKLDEALATSDRDLLGKLFSEGQRSREIFGILFGKKNLASLLEKQAIEQGMSAVEAKALRNSVTGSVMIAKSNQEAVMPSGFVTQMSKIIGVPMRGPKTALVQLVSWLANENIDPKLQQKMDKILGMQGKTAAEQLIMLQPYLIEMGKRYDRAKKWGDVGRLIGSKGLTALVQ